ncbi:hypothetical protein KPL71_001423 [Citrus sinensis]|uniref:Uncharacterized protein n=1 Tax=Citrus sinensis TaxID=2711 RepID=A0ACB8NXZ0_CITSI|nr:hypothetical protein KPL71_001423 [Citrus sinensis]
MDINFGLFLERLRRVLAGEEFTVPDTVEQPIQNLYTETEIVASWLRDSGYNTACITQQKSQSGCSKDICDALLGLQSKIIDIKQRMQQVQHIHSGIVDELKSIEAKANNFPASSSFKNRDTMGLDNRMEELLDLLIEGPPQLSAVAVLDSIGLDQTAFAAEAYRSNYVKHYFDCHAWVQESLPYDADQILYDIINRIEIVASFQFENGENIGLDFVPIGGLLRVTYQGWPFHILYHGIISLNENIEEALDEPRGLQLLAYCMLPFYLKLCCLYLSVFPIHFEICTKQLYQLWIAEGFIPNNNKAIAKKYLEQLINGGFVDAEKRSDIGRINTCSILGRYSPALLTVAFEGEFIISPIMVQEVILRENVKRFTAHEKLNDFAFLDDFDSFLHSLLYLTSGSQYLDPNYCEKICKMFKFLRVLDLGSLVLIRYLSGIQNLFLLRYLKLNIPSLKTLASSLFSSLLNLYTVEMPFSCKDHTTDEFWKMSKLRSKQSGKYLSSQSFNFNKNPAVWGIYFDKTSHDEQISGSRIPQTGIFCRSLVAGEHEQEYSARSRMHHPRGHSGSQPPTRSIRPFLLEVEVERLENQNLASTFWRRLWGAEQKAYVNREKKRKGSEGTIDVGGSSVQGGDLRFNEFVMLREIANEAWEKVMYERMERMEKQMETLTTILHQLRSERRGVQEEGALRGLKEGVKIGRLWYNLRSPTIQTYSAAYEQAKKDIEIEEEKTARIKTDQLEGLRRKKKRALPGNKMPLDEVYEAIKERGLLYLSTPITKLPSRRDRGCYCMFHGTHGHTTAEYRDLKTQSDRNMSHEQPIVRVIAEGPTLAGDSNRLRKNYARYAMTSKEVFFNTPEVPIMWTYEDEEGILYPHEDALVIKATTTSKKFDRILVDTGSSVDVLFKSTLEEMGIADLRLEHTNTSLKGFGGRKLVPLGVVELPITIGSSPIEKTMILDFVVVDEEGPYQMIIGRPFLRMSKAMLSNHYLALKYWVNGVVGVVRGDQRIARSYVFAWTHEDMPGIDPEVACHKLTIRKGARTVRQKRRCFNQEMYEAINGEVEKLLKAGFVREVNYLEWISNVVLVKKTNAGHALLSFMDVFSGYNQIPVFEQDEESTVFISNQGLFCYRVMPFGLKNSGATYQRLVNKIFKPLIGRTMEVCVDDMITKSKNPKEHVEHLEETFGFLRKYKMKLNPEKCAFGVKSGKFLGFMSLTGRLTALSRFISKATYKCQAFFQVIRRGKKIEWTPECEEAFQKLKQYLQQAPLLSTPWDGDMLFLYMVVSDHATSSVLVREEERVQYLIYYTSKALFDAETRYPQLEKWELALVVAARKLRPYFKHSPSR